MAQKGPKEAKRPKKAEKPYIKRGPKEAKMANSFNL